MTPHSKEEAVRLEKLAPEMASALRQAEASLAYILDGSTPNSPARATQARLRALLAKIDGYDIVKRESV